jgi:hypothetical protein
LYYGRKADKGNKKERVKNMPIGKKTEIKERLKG